MSAFVNEKGSVACGGGGIIRQVTTLNQWNDALEGVARTYKTGDDVSGYVALATAAALAEVGASVEMTTQEVDEMLGYLGDRKRMLALVDRAARDVQKLRGTISRDKEYLRSRVSSYDVSGVMHARRDDQGMFRTHLARAPQHDVKADDMPRLQEERAFRDLNIFMETVCGGVPEPAAPSPDSLGFIRAGNAGRVPNRNLLMAPDQWHKHYAGEDVNVIVEFDGHFAVMKPIIHLHNNERKRTVLILSSDGNRNLVEELAPLFVFFSYFGPLEGSTPDTVLPGPFYYGLPRGDEHEWAPALRMETGPVTRLLCLADRLNRGQTAAGFKETTALWDLNTAHVFEVEFYRAIQPNLAADLFPLGLVPHVTDEHVFLLTRAVTGRPLRVHEMAALVAALESAANNSHRYNYPAVTKAVLGETTSLFCDICPEWFDTTELKRIRTTPVVSSGTSYMVPYEVSFQADGANLTVAYPDLNTLPKAHADELAKRAPGRAGRVYQDHFFNSLQAPCHEVVHCLQGIAGQEDTDSLSWAAEHDASYSAFTLLDRVMMRLAEEGNPHIFPGLREVNVLSAYELAKSRLDGWPARVVEAFHKWRASFGLVSPTVVNKDPGTSNHFKSLVELYNFFPARMGERYLHLQLQAIFEGRKGELHECGAVELPAELTVSRDRLARLGEPVGVEKWDEVLAHAAY